MTELDWLTADDPAGMLAAVGRGAADRKLRLFACGCCRAAWRLLGPVSRAAVETSEEFADGAVKVAKLRAAAAPARAVADELAFAATLGMRLAGYAAKDAAAAAAAAAAGPNRLDPAHVAAKVGEAFSATSDRRPDFCGLVREVFGNPFRRPAPPARPSATAAGLAAGIYADRSWDRLPVLADALEEAGCDDPAILAHLRGPGPHARGCWAVDLVLGRG